MSNNNRRIDSTIVAAVIGVMGTLCVTLITLYVTTFAPRPQPQPTVGIGEPTFTAAEPTVTFVEPTWTASPTLTLTNTPEPTSTVPVGEATSTPAPDTPTPEATLPPAPPAVGSDWGNGCISALWRPYPDTLPTTVNNGCLLEPVDVFFANDGRLQFLVAGRFENGYVRGLFAPLPANGTASVNAYLKALQDGEIWIGVFSEPNIQSQGMVIVIPAGNVRQRELIQKTMPGEERVQETGEFSQNPAIYNVAFEFANGAVTTRILSDTVFDPISVGTGQQWLFVGYQVKEGNTRIDAEFLNLLVQGQ